MRQDVIEYVRNCDICQCNKFCQECLASLLQPMPEEKWESISMDYITELPLTTQGHDAIVVFVDRLTKIVRLATTTTDVLAAVVADFVSYTSVSASWCTQGDCERLRLEIHIYLLQQTSKARAMQTSNEHSSPSVDRWAD